MAPIAFLSLTVSRGGPTAFARRGPPELVVCLRGEHDLATVDELAETLARAITLGQADLVIDLSRIEFMDASTVGVLTWARELLRARAQTLVVRTPSSCARRVLELCDLSDLIDPRFAERSMTSAAAALGTWVPVPAVPVPAIDPISRQSELSTVDNLPGTVVASRVGATSETASNGVDDRAGLHSTRLAG